MSEENKHYLAILVELSLYPKIQLITEGSIPENEINKEQQKEIIQFINNLPEIYKKMDDRDEIIAQVLSRMKVKTAWVGKKLEEVAMKKRTEQKSLGNSKGENER